MERQLPLQSRYESAGFFRKVFYGVLVVVGIPWLQFGIIYPLVIENDLFSFHLITTPSYHCQDLQCREK